MSQETSDTRPYIFDLDLDQLTAKLVEMGEAPYRGIQIWQGLYKQFWSSPEQFTNLPASLRRKLASQFVFGHLTEVIRQDSSDGETQKILFNLPDSLAIETVRMGYHHRRTLCISSQAGCAMGCVFCATGQMGFKRHLSSGEIVEQVVFFARQLGTKGEHVTNIVLMGMGEPLHNYDETMKAVDRINHEGGMNIGSRRITISTVGLVPMIRRLASENKQINLAVSLHATEDDLRTSMMPVNRRYPIKEVIQACRDYVGVTHRRITFEWALVQDVNDSPEQAVRLAALLKGLLCHVNVIPLNPTRAYSGKATTRQRAMEFKNLLEANGIPCTVRLRRGIDIQAGCGQLATDVSSRVLVADE